MRFKQLLHPKEDSALAMHANESRPIDRAFTFWKKWLCNSWLSVFATAKWLWLVFQKTPGAVLVCYAAIIPKPTYALFSLSASIHFHLCLWAGVDIRGGEWETVTSYPLFSEMRSPQKH